MGTALIINLQVIADNVTEKEIKVIEIINNVSTSIQDSIKEAVDKIPTAAFNINSIETEGVSLDDMEAVCKSNVFVVNNFTGDNQVLFH